MNTLALPAETARAAPRETDGSPWIERGNNALWLVGALWLECMIVWLAWHWSSFAGLGFHDPDDAMRLVQVRDFLAGQSWFDVSQHRVNPPVGGPMHWSRLVDLPIAGLILLFRPLLGQPLAEIIACVTVPMLTMGTLFFGLFVALRAFLGPVRALLTVALLATAFPILTQMAPLRIDHHAWQIVMAAGLLGGMLHRDPRRGGWIMGAAMALWIHISSEGLPYAAIAGAVLALRYAVRKDEWPRLIRYAGTLAGGSAALLLATHGWRQSLVSHCDSLSPVYLVPLLLLFPALLLGRGIAGDATLLRRAAPVALAGAGAAALFALTGGACVAGPFRTLDPMIYNYWYLGVLEGLPVWDQDASLAGIILVPALVGLFGLALATIGEKDADRRIDWLSILGLALGSFAISVLVLRAMSVAHLFALVGNMGIIARLYPRIAALPRMAIRVPLTVGLCVLSPAGLAIGASHIPSLFANQGPEPELVPAFSDDEIRALDHLPATTLFAEIDAGPDILLRTSHSVIGTGHHRNVEGIGKVIGAFIASPGKARAIVLSTRARYLLLFPALNETERYEKIAPDGLAARLMRGQLPDWLVPVKVPGIEAIRVYRIIRSDHPAANDSATPLMQ